MMNWEMVIDPRTGRFVDGFDPSKVYQFRRLGDDEPVSSYRLADTHPYFNVANLLWRDPLQGMRP